MLRSLIFSGLMLFCLAGCQAAPNTQTPASPAEGGAQTDAIAPEAAGLANPASAYCEEHGGVLELRTDTEGGVSGVCIFPDGTECDEWAYFRGECVVPIPPLQPTATDSLADYAFPVQIDPTARYLFYLHGKIIEDQGLPAVSPDYGEYEYAAILQRLSEHGFRVISEPRPKDTEAGQYAQKVAGQVDALLAAGVPEENITVVGASKGGGIAIIVSNLAKNEEVNYVPMAICSPDTVAELIQAQVVLFGNVLSIYDTADEYAGSCAELFEYSQGKGLGRHEEIVLQVGSGHGVLYQPLDEWVIPVVEWAGGN